MAYKKKQEQRDSWNRWYARNQTKVRKAVRKRKLETKQWLDAYKATLRCEHCDENHPSCLQFHHLDPTKKDLEVSLGPQWGWNIKRILREIAKCAILCANCHIKEHFKLKGCGRMA